MKRRPRKLGCLLMASFVVGVAFAIGLAIVLRSVFGLSNATALALLFAPLAILFAVAMREEREFDRRRQEGRCVACGYDLRGSPSARRCPECGKRPPAS